MTYEIILIAIPTIFAAWIIFQSCKILSASDRNAWDILFLNSSLAIIILFFIGLIVKDLQIWKFVVTALGAVAIGENLSSALQSKKQNDGDLTGMAKFAKIIEEIRIHYLLLSLSFLLVLLSMILGNYFTPSLYLFIYAIGITHMQLLRRQEWLTLSSDRFRKYFYPILFLTFISWSLFWAWALWKLGDLY